MENRLNSYCLFCEDRLKEVLLDNLSRSRNLEPSSEKALCESATTPASTEALDDFVNQPWFWLGSAVTNLLSAHLRLDPTWNYLERWLDNTEFSSITIAHANTVKITGSLWWGYRENIGGAQMPEAIEAEFVLANQQLSYLIKLYADGLCRHIRNSGITRLAVEDAATGGTEVSELLAALKNKGRNAPQKSPMIHLFMSAILHNINYLTAYTIAQSGSEGIQALMELLKDEDVELHNAAIYALGLIGEKARVAIPAILEARRKANQQFRCLAATALCRIAIDEQDNLSMLRSLVPDLLKALSRQSYEDEDLFSDISDIAVEALTELVRQDQSLMALLIKAFKNKEGERSITRIFTNLGTTAKEAIPILTEAMNEKSKDDWPSSTAYALSRMGDDGLLAVTQKLNDEDRRVRYYTTFIIGELARAKAKNARLAILPLIEALKRDLDDAPLRCSLALPLAMIDSKDERVITALKSIAPQLIQDVNHQQNLTARLAIETLGYMGEIAREAGATLIGVIIDEGNDNDLREYAIESLGKIGADANSVIPLLIDMIKKRDSFFSKAIDALLQSGSEALPATLSTIAEILRMPDEEDSIHYEAFKALQKIGSASLPLLVALSKDDDKYLRISSIGILDSLGKPAVPHLVEAIVHTDSDTRAVVAEALGKIGADAAAAIPLLKEAIGDADLNVCARAVEALGQIGKKAVPVLIEALRSDNSFAATWAAAVLGRMGRNANQAIPFLVEALHHEDAQVRELAAKALHHQSRNSIQ